ncbi:chemokine-like protein TAFA-5 isoform X2 [Oryzias melastigma]|uniref:chemokine-like protein TAFA-5 isoform X2 n=1 Tax=Oryzias melastigma TaxID=30732 RepID=UPI00168D5D12|nr:chemokine-like protein TAFA-5 isoform X2 [Oryzias melastigma]
MQAGARTLSAGGGQLAVGTCEIVMLNRDSSVPRRTIARQTARCACRRGQIAGTTRARPACVDARVVRSRQWCEMAPCLEGEVCSLLFNRSGWTCTRGSGRIKTVTSYNGGMKEPHEPAELQVPERFSGPITDGKSSHYLQGALWENSV